MKCVIHPDRAPLLDCSVCRRSFCRECAERFAVPGTCRPCSAGRRQKARTGVPVWVWFIVGGVGGLVVASAFVTALAAVAIAFLIERPLRKGGNEAAAVDTLMTLSIVQDRFREDDWDADGERDFATSLTELYEVGLIDNVLGAGRKSGYVFSLTGGTDEWQCSATPVNENTGSLNFFICRDGVVRFAPPGSFADASSPAVE